MTYVDKGKFEIGVLEKTGKIKIEIKHLGTGDGKKEEYVGSYKDEEYFFAIKGNKVQLSNSLSNLKNNDPDIQFKCYSDDDDELWLSVHDFGGSAGITGRFICETHILL